MLITNPNETHTLNPVPHATSPAGGVADVPAAGNRTSPGVKIVVPEAIPDFATFVKDISDWNAIDNPLTNGAGPSDPAALSEKFDAASTFSASDMYALLALIIKMVREQRTTALDERAVFRKQSIENSRVECAAMKTSADQRFAGELAAGIMGIVGGAVQLSVSVGSIAKLSAGAAQQKDLSGKIKDETAKVEIAKKNIDDSKLKLAEFDQYKNLGKTQRSMKAYHESRVINETAAKRQSEIKLSVHDAGRSKIEARSRMISAVESLGTAANAMVTNGGRVGSAYLNQLASLADIQAKAANAAKEINDLDAQTSFDQANQWRDFLNQALSQYKDMYQSDTQTDVNIIKNA